MGKLTLGWDPGIIIFIPANAFRLHDHEHILTL